MKHFAVTFSLLLLVTVTSCSDWQTQNFDDLNKYSELEPFLGKLGVFEKGRLHLDLNILEAEFNSFEKTNLLENIENIAEQSGWQIVDAQDHVLIITRHVQTGVEWQDTLSFRLANDQQIFLIWRRSRGRVLD
ncbi:MAG: hypothetical protein JJU05_19470 [Verrucomicrobia bacterium]|nr:hypothetical protein [Verrucomicrobiota bacterium]